MKPYKHSNGRIMYRDHGGRFRNPTLKDFGIDVNIVPMICGKCGYGKDEDWYPLVKTGYCPMCNNEEGHKERENNETQT